MNKKEAREYQREWKKKNNDKVIEYRKRFKKQHPDREREIRTKSKLKNKLKNREKYNAYMKKYLYDRNKKYPNIMRAYKILHSSKIFDLKEIVKPPCYFCGSEKTLRHHPNYSEPLNIIWLCPMCHSKVHRGKLIINTLNQNPKRSNGER